jgi:hypothetical protein
MGNPMIDLEKDVHYSGLEVEIYRDCVEDCTCDMVCREAEYGPVEEVEVYNPWQLAKTLCYGEMAEKCLDALFIQAYLRRNPLDRHDVYVSICGGYYGEEISEITIDSGQMQEAVDRFNKYSMNNKIESIMLLEYGYIPRQYMGKEWKFVKAKVSSIESATDGIDEERVKWFERQLESRNTGHWMKPMLAIIARKKGDKFLLIDGNHKLQALKNLKKRNIHVFYCED